MAKMIRQGDVLFVPVKALPDGAKLEKTKIVAYGEATGHNHALVADTKSVADVYSLEGQLFALVSGDVSVVHQEHAALPVEEGVYEIRIQREYTPEAVRQVMD
jgi:hypothetical protein